MTYSLNTLNDTSRASSGPRAGLARFAHETALVLGAVALVFWLLAMVADLVRLVLHGPALLFAQPFQFRFPPSLLGFVSHLGSSFDGFGIEGCRPRRASFTRRGCQQHALQAPCNQRGKRPQHHIFTHKRITSMNNRLGHSYRDRITGFSGVATGHCEYLTGCNQTLLVPQIKSGEGKRPEAEWFELRRHRHHLGFEFSGGHHPLHEVERLRARRVHRRAEQAQLQRRRAAGQAQQPLGAAEARDQAEVDFRLADLRRVGRDAQVAAHRELQAAGRRSKALVIMNYRHAFGPARDRSGE